MNRDPNGNITKGEAVWESWDGARSSRLSSSQKEAIKPLVVKFKKHAGERKDLEERMEDLEFIFSLKLKDVETRATDPAPQTDPSGPLESP